MSVVPKVVFASSLVLLLGVGVLWVTDNAPSASSNLAGDAVFVSADDALSLRPPTTSAAKVSPVAKASSTLATAPITAVPRIATPKRIAISDLAVDAPVVAVGLEADGAMEIPGADEAGWYHYGARPGSKNGSAVIAAHVDHQGKPGVFIELRRLEIGAEVAVQDSLGETSWYSVTERFQVDKDELPAEELFRVDGPPTLTLITCGGKFNRKLRHYSDNIIIRAVPITGDQRGSSWKSEKHHLGGPSGENPGTRVPQIDRR
jgi:LPXTG-site transpeptidase (sortase) family protein